MKGIGLKIWLAMMFLLVIVLLLLWFFQIVFLENYYIALKSQTIKNEAVILMDFSKDKEFNDFELAIEKFAYQNNLIIQIINKDGVIYYTTEQNASQGVANSSMPGRQGVSEQKNHLPLMHNRAIINEALHEALQGNEYSQVIEHRRFGHKLLLIALPLEISGEINSVLFIHMPIEPVQTTASILKTQFLYISIILFVTTFILSFFLARKISKPIVDITLAAEKMGAGSLDTRININNDDEIGKLAETFNYMAEELSKIDKLRKDLIANVSHELRTPLSLIKGYAETLRDVSGEIPEKREKQLGIIISESDRLASIVDDILSLSQLQAGIIKLNTSSFKLKACVESVITNYTLLSEKNGVKLKTQCPENIMVRGDQSRLEQVLYNLLTNAFNHTPLDGQISLICEEIDEKIKVCVSDTGTGIKKEELPHVWDRYYKAKDSNSHIAGAGLGLAIAKEILEAHKVDYGIESKIDLGTTIWFKLEKVKNNK